MNMACSEAVQRRILEVRTDGKLRPRKPCKPLCSPEAFILCLCQQFTSPSPGSQWFAGERGPESWLAQGELTGLVLPWRASSGLVSRVLGLGAFVKGINVR